MYETLPVNKNTNQTPPASKNTYDALPTTNDIPTKAITNLIKIYDILDAKLQIFYDYYITRPVSKLINTTLHSLLCSMDVLRPFITAMFKGKSTTSTRWFDSREHTLRTIKHVNYTCRNREERPSADSFTITRPRHALNASNYCSTS